MKRPFKVIVYIVLAGGVAGLAYRFSLEHTLVLHHGPGASKGRMIACLGGFVAALGALGVLAAYDVAHFFGRRAEQWVLQGGPPQDPPAGMEEVERLRAAGQPLDAIRLLRESLERHPKELQWMARIAEIYRHDLNQPLSAALEYEELLRHKLPADQWAWAGLHLAKLYSRLDQPEKSLAMLERLVNEYGTTVAAGRARKALAELQQGGATAPTED
jgi:signal transduction histidine kinase